MIILDLVFIFLCILSGYGLGKSLEKDEKRRNEKQ